MTQKAQVRLHPSAIFSHALARDCVTTRGSLARTTQSAGLPTSMRVGLAAEDLGELHHVARAEEVVDLGHLLGELARVALRQAPGDDELLAGADLLVLGELEDGVDRLLLRLADEAARVDDDDLGLVRLVDDAPAAAGRDAEHHLGVDPVLDAAEADEVDGSHRRRSACVSGTPWCLAEHQPTLVVACAWMKRSNM